MRWLAVLLCLMPLSARADCTNFGDDPIQIEAKARDCLLTLERQKAPLTAQLSVIDAASQALARSQAGARRALALRRRAWMLAEGQADPLLRAQTALAYARTVQLAERCDPGDTRLEQPLAAAEAGFRAAKNAEGLQQLAYLWGDRLMPARAAALLALAGGDALVQERRAGYLALAGDWAQAAQIWQELLAQSRDALQRRRLIDDLRRAYFRLNDTEKLAALPTE